MGKRNFSQKILNPTSDIDYLNKEYNMIEHILNNYEEFIKSRENLKEILDLERLYRKIVLNRITPAEIGNIYDNIILIKKIYERHINDDKLKSYINLDLLPKNFIINKFYTRKD